MTTPTQVTSENLRIPLLQHEERPNINTGGTLSGRLEQLKKISSEKTNDIANNTTNKAIEPNQPQQELKAAISNNVLEVVENSAKSFGSIGELKGKQWSPRQIEDALNAN